MDLELSEFERLLLDAHVAHCADCRTFADGLTELTTRLRTVPPERPSVSFQPVRRRTRFDVFVAGSVRAASAAAAVAVVAITGLIAFNGPNSAVRPDDLSQIREVLDLHERQLQAVDRAAAAAPTRQVPHGLAAAEREAVRSTTGSRRLEGRR